MYSSSVYSCDLFLISSAFVRSLPFLSFIMPILASNVPLIYPIFLKRFLVFSFPFSPLFLCIVQLRRPSYFSLLFSGSLYSVGYIFPFLPLPLPSLLSLAVCKTSSGNHFAFLHFFSFEMVLVTIPLYNGMKLHPQFFRHSVYHI